MDKYKVYLYPKAFRDMARSVDVAQYIFTEYKLISGKTIDEFEKESDNKEWSGYGMEFTMKNVKLNVFAVYYNK